MIENLKRHMQTAAHNAETNHELIDGKFQMVVSGQPTEDMGPKSNRFLEYGKSYLRRTELQLPRSTRIILTPQIHGITDGFGHFYTQAERDEMEVYQRSDIRTRIPVSLESSEKGLRNLD